MTLRQRAISEIGEILRDCNLRRDHLVMPLFVSDRKQNEIAAMPGMEMTPLERVVGRVQEISDAGVTSAILFGVPSKRTADGRDASDRNGIVQSALRRLRSNFGKMELISDVCICQYNTSGHCGLVLQDGRVDNDGTLDRLAAIAVSHSDAGADIVAPSAMMDGQVSAIRSRLDDIGSSAKILSYSAKHSSSLYSPFRSAAFEAGRTALDKSTYQVSYANARQAMREIELDIGEGADMVMIKPALAYLDLIRMAKDKFRFPIAAQNVSGEYAMIKAAGMAGLIDEEEWKVSSVASIKRAGADRIISYFSLDIARHL